MKFLLNFIHKRKVSTSLASVFNKIQASPVTGLSQFKLFNNPQETGIFCNDTLTDATGFYLFRENAIINSERLVRKAISPSRQEKIVSIFDQLSNCLCKVADLAEFIRVAHPIPRYRAAAEDASMIISAEVEKLNTNKELYNVLKTVVDSGKDVKATTEIDNLVAKLFLVDFEQSGIHLNDALRKIVVNLNEYILHLSSSFMSRSQEAKSFNKSRIPEKIRKNFLIEHDTVTIESLYSNSDNELVRETVYKLYLEEDDHQETLLKNIILSRKKLANLCGFKSFAERAVRGSIVEKPEIIMDFLNLVSKDLKDLVKKDYEVLLKMKKNSSTSKSKELRPWDIPYLTAIYKEKQFSKCIAAAAPYFSLGACMDGINLIINKLFDIHLEVESVKNGELWSKDVIKLSAKKNKTNETLGIIYCDFFERSGKPNQDCHFTIQGGCELEDGSYQMPIVVICLNLSKSPPTLLTPHLVDNLFHEMGHAIHSMLARTPYQHITGTRCSTDLAEVPSILMENFASDHRVVRLFAKHYQTGETINDELIDKWINSKKCFSASETQLQVFYSIFDQIFHSENPLMNKKSTSEVLAEIQDKYYYLPHVENTAWQLRFGHIIGYGAKYYSYLVSRSLSQLIWTKLFSSDPLSREAGRQYCDQVLSHGGGKSPKSIIQDVLNINQIDANFLASSLINDIVSRSYCK